MDLFKRQQGGFLDKANAWMTPERAIAFQGLGMGLSQMDAGQAVNLSPAHKALAQRQQRQQQEQSLKDSGLMDQFTPQERAILATMEPSAAQKIIAGKIFAPKAAPIVVNGQLVDPTTGQVLGDFRTPEKAAPRKIIKGADGFNYYEDGTRVLPNVEVAPDTPDPTPSQNDYAFYSSQELGAGRTPLSFNDWKLQTQRAGASNVTVTNDNSTAANPLPVPEYPKLPTGFVYKRDQQGQIVVNDDGAPEVVPITGGPEDTSKTDALTAGNKDIAGDIVITAAERARQAAGDRTATGLLGAVAAYNPANANAEVYRQVEVLTSNAKVENLNAMRAASPTGGALGSVTERELQMLADRSGALDPASPNFLRDLDDYERTLLRVVHGNDAGDKIFEETRPKTPSVDMSNATREDLSNFDLGSATDAEMDAWEARMKELGLL